MTAKTFKFPKPVGASKSSGSTGSVIAIVLMILLITYLAYEYIDSFHTGVNQLLGINNTSANNSTNTTNK